MSRAASSGGTGAITGRDGTKSTPRPCTLRQETLLVSRSRFQTLHTVSRKEAGAHEAGVFLNILRHAQKKELPPHNHTVHRRVLWPHGSILHLIIIISLRPQANIIGPFYFQVSAYIVQAQANIYSWTGMWCF